MLVLTFIALPSLSPGKHLELETKVYEDFTITEKAPNRVVESIY